MSEGEDSFEGLGGAMRPGDWVSVFAQVSAPTREAVHAEDVSVELFSHNAQFDVHVRRDRVQSISPPRGVALRCTALYVCPRAKNDELLHCRLHDRHASRHSAVSNKGEPWGWEDDDTVGYIEPLSERTLTAPRISSTFSAFRGT